MKINEKAHSNIIFRFSFKLNFLRFLIVMKIWDLPSTEKDAIEFLQERGLHKTRKCRNGHEMKLYHKARPVWECKPCKQQVGVRVGSWFVNTKLPFLTIVRFIYCWSKELTSIAWCEEQLEISLPTAVD